LITVPFEAVILNAASIENACLAINPHGLVKGVFAAKIN
jgi:hypothetical protein